MQFSRHISVGLSVFFVAFAVAPVAQATTLNSSERALLGAVNEVRTTNGLRPLKLDTTLVRAARDYSATLIRRDVFTHGALGPRLARYGARGPVYGENLAWGKGATATARGIVRGWMASPGHRANLLRPGWTRIGIGVRTGTFLGHDGASVVTADFAGS
jgi:uncharacterized protein YkwD